jgi:hypothetical protein
MNTIAPVRARFKTLAAAQDHIENLERQAVVLNAELAVSKTAVAAKAQTPIPPSAPTVNQTLPAVKPIDQMSPRDLVDACDEATRAGDKAAADRYYRAYSERKANL